MGLLNLSSLRASGVSGFGTFWCSMGDLSIGVWLLDELSKWQNFFEEILLGFLEPGNGYLF